MKIAVAGCSIINPGDVSWSGFRQLGELTVWDEKLEPSQLINRLQGYQAVMMKQAMVKRAVLEGCPELQFINLTSTGYDQLPLELLRFARQRGVTICNLPSYGTMAVAQHTFALLLELCNRVGYHDQAVKDGRWGKNGEFCFWSGQLMELDKKVLGVVGFGAIGQAVARMARGFGMTVLAQSTRSTPAGRELADYVTLEQLYQRADVITLHCPLKPETREMINKQSIQQMKDGAILLNTARGGLLQEADVAQALDQGKLGGAGLDVAAVEPIGPDNPLLTAKNCLVTPHMAWAPREARQKLIDVAVENLRAFIHETPVNVINS